LFQEYQEANIISILISMPENYLEEGKDNDSNNFLESTPFETVRLSTSNGSQAGFPQFGGQAVSERLHLDDRESRSALGGRPRQA
jgi:hypothetical protein